MRELKYMGLVCVAVLLFACKKEIKQPAPEPEPEEVAPVENTREQLMRDSIYYYYNLYSYWTESIPDYKYPRTFTGNYSNNDDVLDALMAMTPTYNYKLYTGLNIDPGTHSDRYSYFTDESADGNLSATGFRMDTDEGYGMYFGWGQLASTDTKAYPVLYFVEGGSPAEQAGITRGSIVLAINDDKDVTVGINSDNTINESDYNTFITKFNAALSANSLKIKALDVKGKEKEYNLQYKTYDINPIIADTVYKYSSKNIGYFAFSSFEESDINSENRQNIDNIFQSFKSGNIQDLIVDLRYNGGGYVSTAEYIANKIINSKGNGRLMFSYDVNDYLQQYKDNDFANVNFSSNNPTQLDLQHVYFLVSEQTASAAELLINVLRPYMNVVLIGESTRTYGKPVGFFEQKIMSTISFWPASFKTINAKGGTDYWDGLEIDYPNVDDNIFKDFGDPTEDMIAKALAQAGITNTSSNKVSVARRSSSFSSKNLGIINKPAERNLIKKRK